MAAIGQARLVNRNHSMERTADGRRRFRQTWLVVSDAFDDDPLVIEAAAGLPAVGQVYTGTGGDDADARVERLAPRQDEEHPNLWFVEVEYTTETKPDDPLNQPAVLSWDSRTELRGLQQDYNQKAIINSAGDAFDPPLQEEETIIILRARQRQEGFSPDDVQAYANTVNSDWFPPEDTIADFVGFAPETVRCLPIQSHEVYEGGRRLHDVTYTFEIKPSGWTSRVLDAGYRKKVGDKLESIRDDRGSHTPYPPLLNGMGKPLEEAVTELDANIDMTENFIDVVDGSNFPDDLTGFARHQPNQHDNPPVYYVKVNDEIMAIIGRNGNQLVAARGYLGTDPANHNSGDKVKMLPLFLEFFTKDSVDLNGLPIRWPEASSS